MFSDGRQFRRVLMVHGWQAMANTAESLTKEQAVTYRFKGLEFGHFGRPRGWRASKRSLEGWSTDNENTLTILSGESKASHM